MAYQVEIFNFKTIKHSVFSFSGYTMLQGKNFIGKSAVLMAIRAALRNEGGDDFIRYGEKFAEVRISEDDKWSIVWHKEAGNNYYRIQNGEKVVNLEKAGKIGVPQEISELGFGPLNISKEKVLLWYVEQLKVLFLVDRNPEDFTTDLIASVVKIDAVYLASDKAKKKLANAKSTVKVRRSDLKEARVAAQGYLPLKKYEERDPLVQSLASEANALDDHLTEIKKIHEDFTSGFSAVNDLSNILKTPAPDITSFEEIFHQYTEAREVLQEIQSAQFILDGLKDVEKLPPNRFPELAKDIPSQMDELASLTALCKDFQDSSAEVLRFQPVSRCTEDISGQLILLKEEADLLSNLKDISNAFMAASREVSSYQDLPDFDLSLKEQQCSSDIACISALKSIYQEWENAERDFAKVSLLMDSMALVQLDSVPVQETIDEIKDLIGIHQSFLDAMQEATTLQKELSALAEEQSELDKELSAFSTCPTCGSITCSH